MGQRRQLALETTPHVYEIQFGQDAAPIELQFRPEVYGAGFVDAHSELVDEQQRIQDAEGLKEKWELANAALRRFLAGFMLPDSAETFAELKLPDWALVDMQEWMIGVYGRRPTGSSSGSAPSPPPAGSGSTPPSPSRAATRKRGR